MNVIVVNENKNVIDRLDIDIIKRIDGSFEVTDLLSKFVNLYFNKMIVDITSIQDYTNIEVMRDFASKIDPSRLILLLDANPIVNDPSFLSELVKSGIYNFTRNIEGIKYLFNNPNSYESVKHFVLDGDYVPPVVEELSGTTSSRKVIGLQNMTAHAGSSTLVNLMVKTLNAHGMVAKGLEISKMDLMFYHDPNLTSCMSKMDIENSLRKFQDVDAIIIDLNEYSESEKYCDEILYLIEPSFIRMTKMLKKNSNALNERKNDKILLNMSFVNEQDIPAFEYETRVKVYGNIPPINDRDIKQPEIVELLKKLGFKIEN